MSIRAIRGQKLIRCLLRPHKTISSCPRCRHKTTPHCISANSCDRPGRHLSIETIRVHPCNSWAKKIIRGISVAPAKDNFKLSPLSSYKTTPYCISANSCDRPGRHTRSALPSCPFVQFVGNNISLRTICLEGSTERSDGNRGRSPRIGKRERCAWKALRHRTCK